MKKKKQYELATTLINWYKKFYRELPWRKTKDPYKIWLSEIILQQTRVLQGLPYYLKFVEKYPTVDLLAKDSEQNILRMWQGLGYYTRARNMYATAQYVHKHLNNIFPNTYIEIKKLKGIGEYTAAAIAAFAYNEKVAVLDGNIYRVLARFFGIEDDIMLSKAKKKFTALAYSLIPEGKSNVYNQAIMEFGALHCKPAKPACSNCPLSNECIAFLEKKQNKLPVKSRKIKIKKRFFYYFIFKNEDQILMKCRKKKDIWQGLYDFYHIETAQIFSKKMILQKMQKYTQLPNTTYQLQNISPTYVHTLTHQKISAIFFSIDISEKEPIKQLIKNEDLEIFNLKQVHTIPKPVLINNYLQEFIF